MNASEKHRALEALSGLYLKNHPNEAAQRLEQVDLDEVARLLEAQPESVMTTLFARFSPERAEALLPRLSEARTAHLLAAIDHGQAARLISRLSAEERQRYLDLLPSSLATELQELSSYPPEVAGAVMETRFLALGAEMRVEAALSALRRAPVRPREQVFVVDSEELLLGRVPLADLAVAPLEQTLAALLQPVEAVIGAMAPRDEVAELLATHRVTSLPVLDPEGHLLGVIRQDALLDAARAKMMAGVQAMVGVSREERALSGAGFAIRKRLPWLQVNLATAFLAAAVVGLFEDTIARVTALAVLLPVVAGQSGNTGAQALAVTMRGLALREVRPRQWARVLAKETKVGFTNGLAVAARRRPWSTCGVNRWD